MEPDFALAILVKMPNKMFRPHGVDQQDAARKLLTRGLIAPCKEGGLAPTRAGRRYAKKHKLVERFDHSMKIAEDIVAKHMQEGTNAQQPGS